MTRISRGSLSLPSDLGDPSHNLFPTALTELLEVLHTKFEPQRQQLLKNRQDIQNKWDQGELPQYLAENHPGQRPDWKVAPVPKELTTRRVEITGPVSSSKMVINMLNRSEQGARADMAMMDFEDSMMPSWPNVLAGLYNAREAVKGTLELKTPTKNYKLNTDDMAYPMIRVRGLHLAEKNIQINGESISAGLLDFAASYFHTAEHYLKRNLTPKFYIPKCQHYLEARWWNDLFLAVQKAAGHKPSTLRATFLIETLPAVFQLEEILYEIKDHAAGFNVGRWDKIFSDIKVLKNHPDRILADRAAINMMKPWMENYAKRVIKVCHSHGAFAIGGMSAFTPGKSPEQRETQTKKVLEDKAREQAWGHDGCWVSHPYFIGPALSAFPTNNQLEKTLNDFPIRPDIMPQGGGPKTLRGLRTNVRVGIAYMHGWINQTGCVAWDNLMEDLATLEISRAQLWQWLHHEITLDDGMKVTKDFVKQVFNEELEKILQEIPEDHDQFKRAKEEAQKIFLESKLRDFLSLSSELHN